MARKEITTPLDLNNLNNHNQNYKELYNEIQTTDKRLSENMWEEIKGANTMKMLEPVQTSDQLPATAEDKSLITVIDEQRVYAYVHDEWQPFSEIDLDPFEPFKDELAEIVSAYESKIQTITQEVQTTKDSAIDSIESTQSQSESNLENTKQSAINSINKAQQEAESNIGAIRDEMTTQASDLTALFNDSMDKLISKQDTALAEVDSAKQAAITEIENFQNTDTSNWQKYKLTDDDGSAPFTKLENDEALLHELRAGSYYTVNTPIDIASSTAGILTVEERGKRILVYITFKPYNSNQVFIKRFYKEWSDWEPAQGTKVELFNGTAQETGDVIKLNHSYDQFTELKIKFNRTGGNDILSYDAESSADISINYTNVFNDASEGKLYEMILTKTSLTELTIGSQVARTFSGSTSSNSGIEILKIWGVK